MQCIFLGDFISLISVFQIERAPSQQNVIGSIDCLSTLNEEEVHKKWDRQATRFPIHWAEKNSRSSKRGSKIRRKQTRTKALNWSPCIHHKEYKSCGRRLQVNKKHNCLMADATALMWHSRRACQGINQLLAAIIPSSRTPCWWRRIPQSANNRENFERCVQSAGTILFLLQYEPCAVQALVRLRCVILRSLPGVVFRPRQQQQEENIIIAALGAICGGGGRGGARSSCCLSGTRRRMRWKKGWCRQN
jgi:hypothetical protein